MPAPGGAVFKGIPFAAPPVGDLRWRETQSVKPWKGVLQADQFRHGCGATRRPGRAGEPGNAAAPIAPEGASTDENYQGNPEDCLYLNVWAPQWPAKGKMPVMFWINGGELAGGSGSLRSGAESLARHGVILVSANYRGGLLGMMGHPELTAESPHHFSGNYALLDEIAVLRWIHANIARFGGDPGNVTVFGQSGGGHLTSMLLTSPMTKGLIHRAIIHSGSPFQGVRPYLTEKELENIGVVTAELFKAPASDPIKFLRTVPAADLMAAMAPVRTKLLQNYGGQAYDEGVDGYEITAPINEVWANHKELAIPLMVGSTGVDSGSAPAGIGNLKANATPEETRAWEQTLIEHFYKEPDLHSRALRIYGITAGPNEVSTYAPYGTPVQQIGADFNHRCSVAMTGMTHSVIAPTYVWEFTRTTPGRPAGHGSELRYVFGYDDLGDDASRRQSDIIQQYWTNFAKAGDPNGSGLPAWPKYDVATKASIELATDGPVVRKASRAVACSPYIEKYTRNPKLLSTGADLEVRGAGGAM
jgi:para-nitrobenzyl esterase